MQSWKISWEKKQAKNLFIPITTKLDDVVLSNLKLPTSQRKRGKKMWFPDYGIQAGDDEDIPYYALDKEIQPEQNKQLVPKPPTCEESLADVLGGVKVKILCNSYTVIY